MTLIQIMSSFNVFNTKIKQRIGKPIGNFKKRQLNCAYLG